MPTQIDVFAKVRGHDREEQLRAAREAGWQWRIPLQHRVGNGLVYSSKEMSDADAPEVLKKNVEGELLTQPRVIKFLPGQRDKVWHRNCVAVGLASGFVEPLESTSIHLIQRSAIRLMQTFPSGGIQQADVDEFNAQSKRELEHIRDFIVLHYHVTERSNAPIGKGIFLDHATGLVVGSLYVLCALGMAVGLTATANPAAASPSPPGCPHASTRWRPSPGN